MWRGSLADSRPRKAIVRSAPETGPNIAKRSEPSGIEEVRYGRIEAVYVATSPRRPASPAETSCRYGSVGFTGWGANARRKRQPVLALVHPTPPPGEQTLRRLCNVNQASQTPETGGQRYFRAASREAGWPEGRVAQWIGGDLLDGRLHNPQRACHPPLAMDGMPPVTYQARHRKVKEVRGPQVSHSFTGSPKSVRPLAVAGRTRHGPPFPSTLCVLSHVPIPSITSMRY